MAVTGSHSAHTAGVPFIDLVAQHQTIASEIREAVDRGHGVELKVRNGDGNVRNVEADFVIAGTGYAADVSRLKFLDQDILNRIQRIEGAPNLSINFESSVPGLYFLGPLSFMCFGPLFRFVSGAAITSRRLAPRLCR